MELDKDQKIILDNLKTHYNSEHFNYCQLLPASTGFGKTRVATHLIKYFYETLNIRPFIICPKTLIPMWTNTLKELNIEPVFITTYNKLAGKKECNHSYLTKSNKRYKVTKEWKKNKGVFILCDESHAIKNKTSARHWAVTTLINNNKNGKLLHLTASPIDKRENWLCLYRNIGIVKKEKMLLYENKSYTYKNYGLGDVLSIVKKHDLKLHDQTLSEYKIMSKNVIDILIHLWHAFFIKHYVVPVKDPVYKDLKGKPYEKKLYNFFATLDADGLEIIDEATEKLKSKHIIENDHLNIDNMKSNIGQIQLFLVELCKAKVNTVARLTKQKLKEKHRKVIICCPFIESQDLLYNELKKYKPLILNGKTKNREEMISLFNEPNDNYRCLIMNADVGGIGVDLHDKHGKYPRTMYIIPNYNFLTMYQAPGRIYRRGLKSDTEVYVVYSNDGAIENIIINTLAKTSTASSILLPGSNRVYPGDFPYEIEDYSEKYKELKKQLEEM